MKTTTALIAALILIGSVLAATPEAHRACSDTGFPGVASETFWNGQEWVKASQHPYFNITVEGSEINPGYTTIPRVARIVTFGDDGAVYNSPLRQGVLNGTVTHVAFCISNLHGSMSQRSLFSHKKEVTTTTKTPIPPPPPVLCEVPGTDPYAPCLVVCPE